MSQSGLIQQKIKVHLLDVEEPIEVVTANPDLVRWDMTRAKHKWPTMEEAPMLWATFVSWCAAKRTGLYDKSWDDWSNRECLSVDFDLDDPDQGEEADPTRTGVEHSSASLLD